MSSVSEGATPGSQANTEPTHGFTGQELDPETGLYYYGGRYYDPELGRFISPDPFIQDPEDPQNLNRYSYVLNNPQSYIDPSGYFSFKKFFNIVSFVWSVGSAVAGYAAYTPSPDILSGAINDYIAASRDFISAARGFCDDLRCSMVGEALLGKAQAAVASGEFLSTVKTALEYGGYIPGAGTVTGLASAGISAYEGKYAEALFHAATAIPVAGQVAKLGRAASTVAKISQSSVWKTQTGSYTAIFESGKVYHGKGGRLRSEVSARFQSVLHRDRHIATDWTPAASNREAFKQEALRIRGDPGGVSNPMNYNRINSPGERHLVTDGVR